MYEVVHLIGRRPLWLSVWRSSTCQFHFFLASFLASFLARFLASFLDSFLADQWLKLCLLPAKWRNDVSTSGKMTSLRYLRMEVTQQSFPFYLHHWCSDFHEILHTCSAIKYRQIVAPNFSFLSRVPLGGGVGWGCNVHNCFISITDYQIFLKFCIHVLRVKYKQIVAPIFHFITCAPRGWGGGAMFITVISPSPLIRFSWNLVYIFYE